MKPFQNASRLFLTALICCLSAVAAAQPSGTWSGEVAQFNPSSHYWVKLKLAGNSGTADYPALHCGGTLEFLRFEGDGFIYREHLTYGRDKCIDDGVVTVEPRGKDILWKWEGTGPTSAGGQLYPSSEKKATKS